MAAPVSQSAATMRRVHKELRELQHNLPCTPSSSIFVRYDKARPQFMKVRILADCMRSPTFPETFRSCGCSQVLITGPEDTPYDCGAFVFDICIPDGYPSSPPKVLLRCVLSTDRLVLGWCPPGARARLLMCRLLISNACAGQLVVELYVLTPICITVAKCA